MEHYDTAVSLARGGTAEVFVAWDQELGRKVALVPGAKEEGQG